MNELDRLCRGVIAVGRIDHFKPRDIEAVLLRDRLHFCDWPDHRWHDDADVRRLDRPTQRTFVAGINDQCFPRGYTLGSLDQTLIFGMRCALVRTCLSSHAHESFLLPCVRAVRDGRASETTIGFRGGPPPADAYRSFSVTAKDRLENIVRRFRCSGNRPAVCISTRSQRPMASRNLLFGASA